MKYSANYSKTIGVYLGSEMGTNPEFAKSIILFGTGLVELGYSLVYGGASLGLMGLLAKTMKDNGGKVIGIITEHLQKREISFQNADEMHIVPTMYERKRLIHVLSSRFIVFPGGLGTFDEMFETWCGIKIGTLQKKMGLMNIDGFFDPLLQYMESCQAKGFLTDDQLTIPTVYKNLSDCLEDLATDAEIEVV